MELKEVARFYDVVIIIKGDFVVDDLLLNYFNNKNARHPYSNLFEGGIELHSVTVTKEDLDKFLSDKEKEGALKISRANENAKFIAKAVICPVRIVDLLPVESSNFLPRSRDVDLGVSFNIRLYKNKASLVEKDTFQAIEEISSELIKILNVNKDNLVIFYENTEYRLE